jgi:acetyl-CoA acyltransferase 1
MGITSKNVAANFGVTRKAQDTFAASSFQKAATAQRLANSRPKFFPSKPR